MLNLSRSDSCLDSYLSPDSAELTVLAEWKHIDRRSFFYNILSNIRLNYRGTDRCNSCDIKNMTAGSIRCCSVHNMFHMTLTIYLVTVLLETVAKSIIIASVWNIEENNMIFFDCISYMNELSTAVENRNHFSQQQQLIQKWQQLMFGGEVEHSVA